MLQAIPGRIDALRPIPNDTACQKCHGKKQRQLGVLQISVSTATADEEVARFQRTLGWLAFLPVLGEQELRHGRREA